MGLAQTLRQAILDEVPGANITIESHPGGRVVGTVIADQFQQMTHLERQRRVWSRIRDRLGADATKVGILLMYSPEEAEAVAEDGD